jgi:hypothetical protein
MEAVLTPQGWIATLDLKAGYHHVDMHPEAVPYLAFKWAGVIYAFTSLPFGLATAPWAFTKITRLLVKRWRTCGIACLGYIDDFLIATPSYTGMLAALHSTVLPDLHTAGLQLSMDKCQLEPAQTGSYLGVIVDSARGVFRMANDKRQRILRRISDILATAPVCQARKLCKVTGTLQSMRRAFGELVPLFTRRCYDCLTSVPLWAECTLTETCLAELRFWMHCFDEFNGYRRIWCPSVVATLWPDAAGRGGDGFQGGWAGVLCVPGTHPRPAVGVFQGRECDQSSTWQELQAILNNLLTFLTPGLFSGHKVHVYCDNQAACAILSAAWSTTPSLHALCLRIWLLCMELGVRLAIGWVPREHNTEADALSKLWDRGDWVFADWAFHTLVQLWGPFHVDLFAAPHNAKCPQFYSLFACPASAGVVFPPIPLSGPCSF